MKKLIRCFSNERFVVWFVGISFIVFALETFMLGMWSVPIINYRIPFMSDVEVLDVLFAVVYALVFGFGAALWVLLRRYGGVVCAIGGGSGVAAFFSLLCPVCPIFFLTYFGLSASVMAFAPYVWWIRLLSLGILMAGIGVLFGRVHVRRRSRQSGFRAFQYGLVIMMGVLFVVNQSLAMNMGMSMMGESHTSMSLSGDFGANVSMLVTPTEVPFYGKELGLDMSSLEAINTSIRSLSTMAPMQGSNPIELTDTEMERYVAIGTEPYITCEFCCGVKTLVREDGSPTCACAHSIAMRGTAAYLIRNYPDMTNEQISFELVRQKGMYFPNQMQQRMASALAGSSDEFLPDIKYLTMNLSESELVQLQGSAKSSGFTPSEKAPGMVGGC